MPRSPDRTRRRVAVVMATRGRAQLLARALDALAAQTRSPDQIVVVDDESPDGTPELLESRPGVTAVRVAQGGPGRARQHGLGHVDADIVAFTDDDCVPSPGWLEALVEPIEQGRADAVQGPTVADPAQRERLRDPWHRTQRVDQYNERFPTCNMAYDRTMLDSLGGFAAEFTGPACAGEDTDLGWRCLEAGGRIEFAPDALVHHEVWPGSFWQALRHANRRSMVVLVVKRHPDIRRLAYRRFFYKRAHARALVVLAVALGVGLARPRWVAPVVGVVLAAYLVRTRRDFRPAPRRALHLVQVLVVDVAELVAFAAASVRYRTLYL